MADENILEPEGGESPFEETEEGGGFEELIRYTIPGYVLGLLLGVVLDGFGLQMNPIGRWLVRTFAGEGESFFEGIFAIRQRIQGRAGGMAEAYGWGKFIGLAVPWVIDWGSRAAGVDLLGVQGFYIPFFYGMSDQLMASVSGFVFLRRREGSWGGAFSSYIRHPVMISGLILVLGLPLLLLLGRIVGFRPETQVLAAAETMAANLCWIPPLVGTIAERRQQSRQGKA